VLFSGKYKHVFFPSDEHISLISDCREYEEENEVKSSRLITGSSIQTRTGGVLGVVPSAAV